MTQEVFPGNNSIQLMTQAKTYDLESTCDLTVVGILVRNRFDIVCTQKTFSKLKPFE